MDAVQSSVSQQTLDHLFSDQISTTKAKEFAIAHFSTASWFLNGTAITGALFGATKLLLTPKGGSIATALITLIGSLALGLMTSEFGQRVERWRKELKSEFVEAFFQRAKEFKEPAETLAHFEKYGPRLSELCLTEEHFIPIERVYAFIDRLNLDHAEEMKEQILNFFIDLDSDYEEAKEIFTDWDKSLEDGDDKDFDAGLTELANFETDGRIVFDRGDITDIVLSCTKLNDLEIKNEWLNADDLNHIFRKARRNPSFRVEFFD